MALGLGAAILGGSIISGAASIIGGNKAAKAAGKGADAAAAEAARQFDLIRSDTERQRLLGQGATDILGRLYGISTAPRQTPTVGPQNFNLDDLGQMLGAGMSVDDILLIGTLNREKDDPKLVRYMQRYGLTADDINRLQTGRFSDSVMNPSGGAAGKPDMSAFFTSPDYQFNLDQGQQAINRSLAARGRALSGAGVKEGQRFASGLASNEYSNFTNRLMQMAGLGSAATNTSASAGMTAAGQIGAAAQNAGNARASAYGNIAAGLNNAVQGGLSNYLLARYLGGAA